MTPRRVQVVKAGQDAPGIDHSMIPAHPCPETVLVARMNDDSYLLMAYPQREPAAFVAKEDANVLRQEPQGAFGTPADATVSGNGHENGTSTGTVPPEHKALNTTQAQP